MFQFCISLGWKSPKTDYDMLPIVLSGADGVPHFFDIPEDIILRIKISHPEYPKIEKLHLEWYGLPAVSSMMFEIGGIQFPASPFNGWYADTEIASRDLLDPQRYNKLEVRRYKLLL